MGHRNPNFSALSVNHRITTSDTQTNEPVHDKSNIVRLRPALIQISLRIRAV
jgi:hypothetical protein